ncbi:hypothetical protein [Mammaliicoccus sciuri]|uniref:hypothetical protein n=1 Tax=Mammaliicoccus sciuri TaxID=1296 RepID=UPI001F4549A5|nr:hypothetical protein [Mammaliicoccus sciuri]MCE5086070.1 hypothetical protein [Mammaliicoccus sciuri]
MNRRDPLVSIVALSINIPLFLIFSTIIWKSRNNMIEIGNLLTDNKLLNFFLPLIMLVGLSVLFLLIMFVVNKIIFHIFNR